MSSKGRRQPCGCATSRAPCLPRSSVLGSVSWGMVQSVQCCSQVVHSGCWVCLPSLSQGRLPPHLYWELLASSPPLKPAALCLGLGTTSTRRQTSKAAFSSV